MTSLCISWPRLFLFFILSSLSFSFPVSTCLSFAALFCTLNDVGRVQVIPASGGGHGRMRFEVISYQLLQSDFLFHSFSHSLWTGKMKRGWAQVTRRGWVPVSLLGLSVQIIWQGEVAATAAGRLSCSRAIRSRCTHLLTLADNFLGWEWHNCLQMKRVFGDFYFFLSFLIYSCACV